MTKLTFSMWEGESFFGGVTHMGSRMPLDRNSVFSYDLARYGAGNQSAPFFLSTKGRYLWSDEAFRISFDRGCVTVEGTAELLLIEAGSCLRDAYLDACRKHFPPTGEAPEPLFYTVPQYNTWVELLYDHNQTSVLDYAKRLLGAGFQPGILMIDDTWQENYGVWRFHPGRFRDPRAMVDELHALGFRVMLWLVPYLSADSPEFREAEKDKTRLIRNPDGKPLLVHWWNGYSAALDLTSPGDRAFLDRVLGALMTDFGVDGFKFDGGAIDQCEGLSPEESRRQNKAWFSYAAGYRFNEAKDSYDGASLPLNQRLRDKSHAWAGSDGLSILIPDGINASLLGYRFLCPDMVGGGQWTAFLPGAPMDEELIVRSAECSALFPMMQFSVAPHRVLSPENLAHVLAAARLHREMGETILALVKKSAVDGEPILAPLCYHDPDGGLETVTDEFMLGRDILSAPVLRKGATERTVRLPAGTWRFRDGTVFGGRSTVTVPAPLGALPYFTRIG